MTVQDYVEELNRRYKSGISREHSYRGDLQSLLESLLPGILVTNEPKRSDVGAPDYILTKGKIPVGYVEAKDIDDPDLSGKKKNKEQFNRYKDGLPNLIFTDYLDFHLYRDSEFITSIRIAEVKDGKIIGKPAKYAQFEDLIKDFGTHVGQTIRSANKLSKMMAGKARLLANVIENALNVDEKEIEKGNVQANNTLREQLSAFQNILIHDIDAKEFSDIYAQTIAYGMFAARLHDPSLDTFDRREAAELIPKTNPFLRRLFGYIAGPDIDERIVWIVDSLADVFRATDVDGLLKNFGIATHQQDPIIHFYETFLAEYDPSLRKSRGVWYTPEPVVNFIVRAVDDILKDEFGLKDGLADTSKTTVKVNTDVPDKRSSTGYKQEEREVHKVQILDPATGTGTFLAEVIKQIHTRFEGQQGIWKQYVEEHLIPRLNGFEILMASYAMAHLKLDLLLRETGVEPSGSQRFRVYLTNSLEEHHPDTGTLFANWLSQEANEANHVKRDTPVMVVMGNPPYSVSSSNKSEWIEELMQDYKKDLNERNINPLSDDYIKFIRYGQHYIQKNGEGILAYISNNSFIDGVIHRRMREMLLNDFDLLYIIDLHGNSNKREVDSKGNRDQNVFDIQQGVSINILVKTHKSTDKTSVKHSEILGSRNEKYNFLNENGIETIDWKTLKASAPNYFFVPKDFSLKKIYETYFSLNDLFPFSNSGIKTHRDDFIIDSKEENLVSRIKEFYSDSLTDKEIISRYSLKESKTFNVNDVRNSNSFKPSKINKILYRPFDDRSIYYDSGLIDRAREDVVSHIIEKKNLTLITVRQAVSPGEYMHFMVSQSMSDNRVFYSNKGIPQIIPLYLYPEESTQQTLDGQTERTPNLDKKIVQEIAEKLGLKFVPEKEDTEGTFAPIDLLDFIYAVLHSPSYREKYKEFLKIDFPRVPYPKDTEQFWKLVELGGELRQIHLLEHPVVEDFITTYPESGDNVISNRLTKADPGFIPEDDDESIGKVWINEKQYFGNVPKKAWEFYIGGYQPAEKWLKDRRDRELSIEEIQHYQKIIVALMETDRIMRKIDGVWGLTTKEK
ncbi:type ISP restriction/modification enzyme [Fodinibius sp.]|uniref:type ISP restriction/modification enzyme n=1 Tax=Fodinibius sp. TaxID=1872440 RepID=UPI002ACEEE45|nr:type ISP restriction/modification enzyme [Fodinibius sp.]MDZ7660486.1 type ISP restriction/modification enzyme [Fodinibius sp.]